MRRVTIQIRQVRTCLKMSHTPSIVVETFPVLWRGRPKEAEILSVERRRGQAPILMTSKTGETYQYLIVFPLRQPEVLRKTLDQMA